MAKPFEDDLNHDYYRFEVSLSFAGDNKRETIREIANQLKEELGSDKVFFDEDYKHEFAGVNADTYFQEVYRQKTRLVVACVCKRYNEKTWTKHEWRAIRSFMSEHQNEPDGRSRFLPIRFDDGDVDGLFPEIDIIPDVRQADIAEIVSLIMKRHELCLHQQPNQFQPTKSSETAPIKSYVKPLSDIRKPWFWWVVVLLLLPAFVLTVGMGPPWSASSSWQQFFSVLCITMIVQVLFFVSSIFVIPISTKNIRKYVTVSAIICFFFLVAYIVQYSLFTEEQPNLGHRLTVGWHFSQDFRNVMSEAGLGVADAKTDFGYQPFMIYEPWSVWASFLSLLLSWMAFFGSTATLVGILMRYSVVNLWERASGRDRN